MVLSPRTLPDDLEVSFAASPEVQLSHGRRIGASIVAKFCVGSQNSGREQSCAIALVCVLYETGRDFGESTRHNDRDNLSVEVNGVCTVTLIRQD